MTIENADLKSLVETKKWDEIIEWFEDDNNCSPNDVIKTLDQKDFRDTKTKDKLIKKWLDLNPDCDYRSFHLIAGRSQAGEARTELLIARAGRIADVNERYDLLLQAIEDNLTHCPHQTTMVGKIAETYLNCGLPASKIPDVCRDLYPVDEIFQRNLFLNIVKITEFSSDQELIEVTKDFISQLAVDAEVREILNEPKIKEALAENNNATNDIHKSRAQSRYKYLFALLGEEKLVNHLDEGTLEETRKEHGDDCANLDFATLLHRTAINSPGDFAEQLRAPLATLTTPNKLRQVESVYVSPDEVKLLQGALSTDPTHRLPLPEMSKLTTYLREKIGEIPPLTQERAENYQINFDDSSILLEKRDVINQQFRLLLQYDGPKENPEFQNAVMDFFENFLDTKINPREKPKLAEFILGNRDGMALLFEKKDKFDRFMQGCAGSIKPGCVANVGTQARLAFTEALIDDPSAQILYAVFASRVCTQLLNNSPDDELVAGATGKDIFSADSINLGLISPAGFITAASNEFHSRDPWKFIGDANGDIFKHSLLTKLEIDAETKIAPIVARLITSTHEPKQELRDQAAQTKEEFIQTGAVKVATYIALQKSLPEIITGSTLESEVENILSERELYFNEEPVRPSTSISGTGDDTTRQVVVNRARSNSSPI